MVELNFNQETNGSGTPIEDPPEGNQTVQCFGIFDLGVQPSKNPQYGPKHQIKIGFESEKKIKQGPDWAIDKPFGFYLTFNLSAHEKSRLMQFLNNWIINLEAEMEKCMSNDKLDLTKLLVGRYGTGVVGKEKWNDGEMHMMLKSVFPASEGHTKWQLINGPQGTSQDWKYPKSIREKRTNALTKPEDYPNAYDEDQGEVQFP